MNMFWRTKLRAASLRDRGASLVEYALLVAMIAVACMSALIFFQQETSGSLSRTANSIHSAG